MYALLSQLNQFLLTYDTSGKSAIDVFNDFTEATANRYDAERVPEILDLIDQIIMLDFGVLVSDAEISSIIPSVLDCKLKERLS